MSATMASANLRATGAAPRVVARSSASSRVATMFRTAGPDAERKLGDAMVAAAGKFGAKHQMEVRAALSEDAPAPERRAFLKKALLGVRARADPRKKLLRVLWRRSWTDAKQVFGHPRVALKMGEITQAFEKHEFGEEGPQESAIALVPANPTQLLSHDNLVVVENNARRQLLRAYRQGGETEYASALEHLD